MRIGILECVHFTNTSKLKYYIDFLYYLYRPFGNMGDEYEEPITLIVYSDMYQVVQTLVKSAGANFSVEQDEDIEFIIDTCDKIVIFIDIDCDLCRDIVQESLDRDKHIEIFTNTETDNGKKF